jgi:hypothetical protein
MNIVSLLALLQQMILEALRLNLVVERASKIWICVLRLASTRNEFYDRWIFADDL